VRKDFPNLSIVRQTSGPIPDLPFRNVKETILGKKYDLSLVFATTHLSSKLHTEFKKKSGPANTLAFPFDETSGEIFLHLNTIRKQAHEYNRTYMEHLLFIYIHALLHLQNHDHGDKMEKLEEKFYSRFVKAL
jgi:rRNA maturation RNase YbeY